MSAILLVAAAAFPLTGSAQVKPSQLKPELPQKLPTTVPKPEPIFPIPPTVERPLNVQEGARLFVKKFELKGVINRPKQGVSLKDIQRLVEDLRVQKQGLDKIGPDGFTTDERKQIQDFVSGVVKDRNLDMRFQDYEALIDKLRELRAKREAGMTIGQMQQIAAAVTEYYRSAGFILAQAFIPAQEVTNGDVTIEVLEGKLGNVLVEGNKSYSDKILARPFKDLIDAPVTASSIEQAILLAGDNPGVNLFGVFQPGHAVGKSDLVLNVQSEKPYDASLRIDNHGTRFTGKDRVFGEFNWNSPSGVGDRLTVQALKQYRPKNSFFGQVTYERPVLLGSLLDLPGWTVGGSYSRNPFHVAAELRQADLSGVSTIGELWVKKAFKRSRAADLWGQIGFKRTSSISLRAKKKISQDELASINAKISFDSIDAQAHAINQGDITLTEGLGDAFGGHGKDTAAQQGTPPSRQGGSGKFASNDFHKATIHFARLQKLTENSSLLFRFNGQWTNGILPSAEQFNVGGPNSVRAFPVSERTADVGAFSSAELSFNAPFVSGEKAFSGYTWGQILRLSFFTDAAWSKINDPGPTDDAVRINAGWGAALSVNVPGKWSTKLQWAEPIGRCKATGGKVTSTRATNPKDCKDVLAADPSMWWFDFTYQF